ncbi:ATP-binding protein [Alicyclobacillus mengziensis]|uniref:Oxygen sensor histidine kinase NreB n=1 Tax=Alicyclobacillus mengziensis TaxID=2931921 RepID=A0A9X7Z7J4_9BACL|nr:ATP-binding protein [Alicyclobacillus mengziensis]QSO47298.1 hypothetical protein JZ786_23405 [Alicyclobacillus mengziensis]
MISVSGHLDSAKLRLLRLRELRGEERIIYLYRFVSFGLTSCVFLLKDSTDPRLYQWGVVTVLFAESLFVSDMYRRNRLNKVVIQMIILIETLGIAALVAFTGGIESPFIWFAVSPVLIAATLLNPYYSWANLVFYLLCAICSYEWLYPKPHLSIWGLLRQNLDVMLILVLLTLAVQLYSAYASQATQKARQLRAQQDELQRTNHALEQANQELAVTSARERASMQEMISLYQAVQEVTSEDDVNALAQIFADYTTELTHRQKSFIWMPGDGEGGSAILKTCPQSDASQQAFSLELERLWGLLQDCREPTKVTLLGNGYVVTMVRSSSTRFALLGHDASMDGDNASPPDGNLQGLQPPASWRDRLQGLQPLRSSSRDPLQPLLVLAELCGVILERRKLEKAAQRLLVSEEQNRIAGEMHDNVSQRLFSVVYALHALNKSWPNLPPEDVKSQLAVITETAQAATQEFRRTIYHLSSRHQPENLLRHRLLEYLDEVRDLNGIDLDLDFSGDEQAATPDMKPIIYRVVAEAVGNAIRHGQCTRLRVEVRFGETGVQLRVEDNGCGFNPVVLLRCNVVGLGLQNMKSLVQTHAGRFDIESAVGKGTLVKVEMKYPQYQVGFGGAM